MMRLHVPIIFSLFEMGSLGSILEVRFKASPIISNFLSTAAFKRKLFSYS
jgi:hypothetical protein